MLPKNRIIYANPYVYVRSVDMDIQTGQGRVTLGSIDIMIDDWLPARWDASLSWWPPTNYNYEVFALFLFVFV